MTTNTLLPFRGAPRGKRGIALIVVLGMLALLVMTGVAFSVFMRTERHAAGSFQHDVRAGQLLFAAKARALEALERDMAGRIYPDWVALASPGAGISFALPNRTNLLWSQHVPDSILANGAFPNQAGWISVNNGRVGYIIINASGLVDANRAGGATRAAGLSPSEIDLAGLSEMSDVNRFIQNRDIENYESITEMKRAGSAIGLSGVSHLVDYSMAATNFSPAPFDLSGSYNDLLAKRGDIKAILDANFSSINSDTVVDSLLDYVDADNIPRNLNGPSIERIPMINEVRFKPILFPDVANMGVRLRFLCNIELCYPFVSYRPESYTLDYNISIASPPGVNALPAGFPVPGPLVGTVNVVPFVGSTFTLVTFTSPETFIPCVPWAGTTAKFNITVNSLQLKIGATTRDQVTNLRLGVPALPLSYASVAIPAAPVLVMNGLPAGSECADPRYNFDAVRFWMPYQVVASTFGGSSVMGTNGTLSPLMTNAYALYAMKFSSDNHMWMHTADQPLQSATELSYLIRGGTIVTSTCWRTLRLLEESGQDPDPILKYFTVASTNLGQRGMINPNTDNAEAMAAALRNMVLDRFPGDSVHSPLMKIDAASAMNLANDWISDPGSASYWSPGDVVTNNAYKTALATWIGTKLPTPVTHDTARANAKELRLEAGYRNLIGLLNPRQNYFMVILFAQSASRVQLPRSGDTEGAFVDTIRADQTALMEVWRDPVPRNGTDAAGQPTVNYPMLVRRFDILSQE